MPFDGTHQSIPFSGLHISKLRTGLKNSLVVNGGATAPEGVGDIFLATDALELYVCRDGSVWELFTSGGGSEFNGLRWTLGVAQTVPGTDTADYIQWDGADYTYGDFGSPGSLILIPLDGFYRFTFNLILNNLVSVLWTFQVWSSDFNVLQTHQVQTDGSGDPVNLCIAGEFKTPLVQPTTGAWFYVDAAQDGGGSVLDSDILDGSYVTLSYIAAVPA